MLKAKRGTFWPGASPKTQKRQMQTVRNKKLKVTLPDIGGKRAARKASQKLRG
jgi:hypothetical protein